MIFRSLVFLFVFPLLEVLIDVHFSFQNLIYWSFCISIDYFKTNKNPQTIKTSILHCLIFLVRFIHTNIKTYNKLFKFCWHFSALVLKYFFCNVWFRQKFLFLLISDCLKKYNGNCFLLFFKIFNLLKRLSFLFLKNLFQLVIKVKFAPVKFCFAVYFSFSRTLLKRLKLMPFFIYRFTFLF